MISVRITIALLLGTIAVLLCGLGYVTSWQVSTAALQAQAESRRHEAFALSEAMRQSSDQLTGMTRLYVATGEPRYEQYYEEILAIRAGAAPRPRDYDGSFWDRVLAHGKAGVEYGPPVSFVDQMRAAHLSEAESAALTASLDNSNELARVEIEVMDRIARRVAQGVDARYPADVRLEDERLMDAAYADNKDRIMEPIRRFQSLVDERTRNEIEALRARGARLLTSQVAFLFVLLALSIAALIVSERVLTRPLRSLMQTTQRISAGDYAQRVGSHTLLELQHLGENFNDMASAIRGDIARREQAEKRAVKAQAEAERANEAKSVFLATMSHEIRTPLNAVIGMSAWLARTRLEAGQRDAAGIINSSGEHLLSVIDDILDFTKIEAGVLELDEQLFEPRRAVEEAIDLVAFKAAEKQLDVTCEIAPGTPEVVKCDRGRVRQILVNYLSNAIKFTERGGIVVTVSATPLEHGLASGTGAARHLLRIAVRDTGIGIAEDRIERLFKSFSQVDASTTRRYGGTGLGLAISKRLAERMGGGVAVESRPGAGSTFSFTVVVATDPAWIASDVEEPGSRTGEDATTARGLRILLAEDNAMNQKVMLRILEMLGGTADVVDNGLDAVRAVERQRYDVVLMDVQMPVMDGVEATRRIRKLPAAHQPRICAMTASALKSERQECIEAGMDRHIAKPIGFQQLAEALREVAAAPGSGASADDDGTDRAALARLVDEVGRDGALEVLDTMIGRAEHVCRNLCESSASGDFKRLGREVRSMKANCAMVGAMVLSSDCRLVERSVLDGAAECDRAALDHQVRSLAARYAELAQALTRQRARLQTP